MIITLVMDQYGSADNGTTITTRRFAEALKKKGHVIRIITSSPCNEENMYQLDTIKIPLFDNLIHAQGMIIAKPDDEILRQAIRGSDIVHLLMPFAAQKRAREIALEEGVACTAAFHVQPQNITYSVHLGKNKAANSFIFSYFKNSFYKYFTHIHCPSEFMKSEMVAHGYPAANIHAISNGVAPQFIWKKSEKPKEYAGKFLILMIGRYSAEKRQDLIIKAISKSKYKSNIQLILCGKGPLEKNLRKLAEKKIGSNNITFTFLNQEALINLINFCDLYIHASDAESEAISCMEAFTCGLVPIISDSKKSATNQFALSDKNLFAHGNYNDLATKIDWFYENPKEKEEISSKYVEYAKQFALDSCVEELENVFIQAIKENKERLLTK